MIFLKENPKDIDVPIQYLQQLLHTKLGSTWNLADDKFHAYGRCERLLSDGKYVPEVFNGGKDYKEVLLNDKLHAQFFFGVSDTVTSEEDNGNTTQLHVIFFVDLTKAKPDLTHRGDAEVRNDVELLLRNAGYGFTAKGSNTGIDKVFSEYSGARETLKHKDMQPIHIFRFNLDLTYSSYNNR